MNHVDSVHGAFRVPVYADGRPNTRLRMVAKDEGIVLRSGDGPGGCDLYGAREASVFRAKDRWYLFYDGAGLQGWTACLAVSDDLRNWRKLGEKLSLGAPGQMDSGSASAPWLIEEGGRWHMFYLGTPNTTPAPYRVPSPPYLTMKAWASDPEGPWTKQYDVTPFRTRPGSWMADVASPGFVIREGGEYLLYFSGAVFTGHSTAPWMLRTLGLARTRDLDAPMTVDEEPILPLEEQIENSSLYFEESTGLWYLFTNHIGIGDDQEGRLVEYTDAVWVYWSRDPRKWNPADKAVVLDGQNCTWSRRCIGMPSVVRVGERLAMLYDAAGGDSIDHNLRHIGLAWLDLPLEVFEVE